MEEQCSPLGWAYYYQEDGVDELKQSLLCSTLEQAALISAHDEISRKDDEILQLKALLSKVVKERDEFRDLALEKKLLVAISSKQHIDTTCPISSGTTSDDQDDSNINMSPSVCDDNFVQDVTERVALKRALPEQGMFLQAVMDAGPLLQTLLLAGALPRWQHPPPKLNSTDIPPVVNSTNKRGMVSWDGSPSAKYQKVCPRIIIDPTHM